MADGIQPRELTQDLRLDVVSREQAATVPAEGSVICQLLVLRAAWALEAAIAQADRGDIAGAIDHLEAFLALPEVVRASDPEVRAALQRLQAYCRGLESQGYDRHQRKQMHYSSYRWTSGKGKPSEEPATD